MLRQADDKLAVNFLSRLQVGREVGIRGKLVVGAPGFEPGASCAQGRRATRLRYAPTRLSLEFTGIWDFVDVA